MPPYASLSMQKTLYHTDSMQLRSISIFDMIVSVCEHLDRADRLFYKAQWWIVFGGQGFRPKI